MKFSQRMPIVDLDTDKQQHIVRIKSESMHPYYNGCKEQFRIETFEVEVTIPSIADYEKFISLVGGGNRVTFTVDVEEDDAV